MSLPVTHSHLINLYGANRDPIVQLDLLSLQDAIEWTERNGYHKDIEKNLNGKIKEALKEAPAISKVHTLHQILSRVNLIPNCRERAFNELFFIVKSSPSSEEAYEYLVDLLVKLTSDLKQEIYQKEKPCFQIKLIKLFGILIVKVLKQYNEHNNRTKITEELKSELRKLAQGLARLNHDENTEGHFFIEYALEGIKRLESDQPEYKEIIGRLGHLAVGIAHLKDLKFKEFGEECSVALKDVEKHLKFGWFDKLILIEQFEEGVSVNVEANKEVFSQFSTILSKDWKDKVRFTWKLEYGVIEFIERIALKKAPLEIIIPLLAGNGKCWEGIKFYLSSKDERVRCRVIHLIQHLLLTIELNDEIKDWLRELLKDHYDDSKKVRDLIQQVEELDLKSIAGERKDAPYKLWENEAEQLFLDGKYQESAESYTKAILSSLVPDHKIKLFIKKANCFLKNFEKEGSLLNLKNGLDSIGEALLLSPFNLKVLSLKAQYFRKLYEIDKKNETFEALVETLEGILSLEVKTNLDNLLQQDAKDRLIDHLFSYAKESSAINNFDEAIKALKKINQINPKEHQNEEVIVLLAFCYEKKSASAMTLDDKKSYLKKAIDVMESILAKGSKCILRPIHIHYHMGLYLWRLSEYEMVSSKILRGALKHLQKAVDLQGTPKDKEVQEKAKELLNHMQGYITLYNDKQKIINVRFPNISKVKDSREIFHHVKSIVQFLKCSHLREEEKKAVVREVIQKLDDLSYHLEGEMKKSNPNKVALKIIFVFLVQQKLNIQIESECFVKIDFEEIKLAKEHLQFAKASLPQDKEDKEALGLEVESLFHQDLAVVYHHEKKFNEACHYYKIALSYSLLETAKNEIHFKLCKALLELFTRSQNVDQKKVIIDEAIDYATELLKNEPNRFEGYVNLVLCFEKKWELTGNVLILEEALDVLKGLDKKLEDGKDQEKRKIVKSKINNINLKIAKKNIKKRQQENATIVLKQDIEDASTGKGIAKALSSIGQCVLWVRGSANKVGEKVINASQFFISPITCFVQEILDDRHALSLIGTIQKVDLQDYRQWSQMIELTNSAFQILHQGRLNVQNESRLRVHVSEWFELQGQIEQAESVLTANPNHFKEDVEDVFQGHLQLTYASIQHSLGNYLGAIKAVRKARIVFERTCGENIHPLKAKALNLLGITMHHLGSVKRSKKYIQDAFDMQLALLKGDENHPDLADFYNSRATVAYSPQELMEAKRHRKKALDLRESRHPMSLAVVRSLTNLGVIFEMSSLENEGDAKEAEGFYTSALEISAILFKRGHPDQAILYLNLGILSLEKYEKNNQKKNLENAEKYLLEAIKIMKIFYKSKSNAKFALAYHYLGLVYQSMDNLENALKCHGEAERLYDLLGDNAKPQTALALHNQGYILYKMESYQKALEVQKRALSILLNLYGDRPQRDVAVYHRDLGLSYMMLDDEKRAQDQFKKAKAIRVKIYPEGHPAIKSVDKLIKRDGGCVIA